MPAPAAAPRPSPSTAPRFPIDRGPSAWVGWVFQVLFTAPWARIDARDKSERLGRLTARQALVVTAVVSALMLVLLRFVVMDRGVQSAMAVSFVGLVGEVSPEWGRAAANYQRLGVNLAWVVGCFAFYFAVPALVVKHVFGMTLADFYLKPREYTRHLPLYGLLFLPVAALVLLVAKSPEFLQQYPFYQDASGWTDRLMWEFGYALQFFSLEFFFRGFMLRGMSAELGSMAVMAMMIPYCMIHFGKPLPECLGSIIAGMVLGTLAMDTRSIWGGVTIHVAVAWMMDGASLWQQAALTGHSG
jgi:membrane protease YdiL (CAAX protease family)